MGVGDKVHPPKQYSLTLKPINKATDFSMLINEEKKTKVMNSPGDDEVK